MSSRERAQSPQMSQKGGPANISIKMENLSYANSAAGQSQIDEGNNMQGYNPSYSSVGRLDVPIGNMQLVNNSPYSPFAYVRKPPETKGFVDFELPKTVVSVRDGWQWTSSSGAVVSGLLASVAAQLLGFFKDDDDLEPQGAKDFLVACCYAAIFLNINATIGSFVLIDHLGEIGYQAAKLDATQALRDFSLIGNYHPPVSKLLREFGASSLWKVMLVHWLVTFYLGILSLIISVLTYVMMREPCATKVVMGVTVALTLLPTSYFIFLRGFNGSARQTQNQTRSRS